MTEQNGYAAKKNAIPLILAVGLLVGTLDILSAFVDYYITTGKNPLIVLRFIARGVFRQTALNGGSIMYFWGLTFHYIIAQSFTFFFYWVFSRLHLFYIHPIVTGVIYGLFIYLVMNLLVLPVVFGESWLFKGWKSIKAALILICMIGLPLSFIFRNYFLKRIPLQCEKMEGK